MNSPEPLPLIVATAGGPTAVGASPDLLSHLLGTLEKEALERSGVSLAARLRPGLGAASVGSALRMAGLGVPRELVIWFGWHDGEEKTERPALPNFSMASLDEAISSHHVFQSSAAEVDATLPLGAARSDWGVGPDWLPLSNESHGLVIQCSGDPSGAAMLRSSDPEFHYIDPPLYRAVSLCTVVVWWIQGIRSGAYRWTEDGGWIVDRQLISNDQRLSNLS